jgi:hypothetical protein
VARVGDAADLARALGAVLEAAAPNPAAVAATVAGFRIGPIAETYLRMFDVVVSRRRVVSAPGARRRTEPDRRESASTQDAASL